MKRYVKIVKEIYHSYICPFCHSAHSTATIEDTERQALVVEERIKEFAWEWFKKPHGVFMGKMDEALTMQMFESEWKEVENE